MTSDDHRLTLISMTDDECREALNGHSFGRLAFALDDGPTVLPINYAYVNDRIVMRTALGSKLSFAPMTAVAFEIDEVNETRTSGWSVVARGHAFDITSALDEESEDLRALPFTPWLSGEKANVLKINVRELTGRKFGVGSQPGVANAEEAAADWPKS